MTGKRFRNFTVEELAAGHPLRAYLAMREIRADLFARRLGVTPVMIYQWIDGKKPVSAFYAVEIEKLTEGAVRCEELLPRVDWQGLVELRRGYEE